MGGAPLNSRCPAPDSTINLTNPVKNPIKALLSGVFSGAAAALAAWGLKKLHDRREKEPADETGDQDTRGQDGHHGPDHWRTGPVFSRPMRPVSTPHRSAAAGYYHRGNR